MKQTMQQRTLIGLAAAVLGVVTLARAGETANTEEGKSFLEEWWNGKSATGNWFGVRDTLEDHGLKLGVESWFVFPGCAAAGQQRAVLAD